ncbi:MAG TPA: cation:proton antiporter [Acidimicrobiia bacterium]|nr:cation:proton antiporter [Acidimicrobiia bacterium]
MFGSGSLAAGTLLGVGVVVVAVALGARLAAAIGLDPLPVPLVVGLAISAVGPLHVVRPDAPVIRAGAEIALVVLLFCVGLAHGGADRRAAAATVPAGRLLALDAGLNVAPGLVFGLLGGFGPTGAVLLGGVAGASSWTAAMGRLDRRGRFGNRETPAVLAVLVGEHCAIGAYLPLAAALLAPGGAAARATALLGSAAVVAAAAWFALSPPAVTPRWAVAGARAPHPAVDAVLLAGAALLLAGLAVALGVPTAGVAYLAGGVMAEIVTDDDLSRAVGAVRQASTAVAALGLGLLVPAGRLPGALAGGLLLAALGGAGKIVTGWWAAAPMTTTAAGRLRAGLTLVPRGEIAVAFGLLVALSAPGHGPGTGLAALIAVEVVLTTAAPAAVGDDRLRQAAASALLSR